MPVPETFTIIRSRRRTLSLEIGRGGEVVVRAPMRAPRDWIFGFVERQRGWIERRLRERLDRPEPLAFAEGSPLPHRGARFPLVFDPSVRDFAFDGSRFFAPRGTSAAARLAWTAWSKRTALDACLERARELAAPHGLRFGRVSVREAKTRWGSCSPSGDLMFNWKLILASPEALDYVVAHELAHLIVKNHSRRFWNEVARILPSYSVGRRWLKERESALLHA